MESGIVSGIESGWVIGVAAVALTFGIIYDKLVSYLEQSGRAQGYTALLVTGGVFMSLALAGIIIGLEAFLVCLVVFALTGIPMLVGSIWRHTDQRLQRDEQVRAVVEELREDSSLAREILHQSQAMQRERGDDDGA